MRIKLVCSSIVMACCFVMGAAQAQAPATSVIVCPNPGSLIFKLHNPNGTWDKYLGMGYTRTLKGHARPFLVIGDTQQYHRAARLNWATYYEPTHSFICVYESEERRDMVLAEEKSQPILQNCRFITGHDSYECPANTPEDCQLECVE